MTRLFTGVTDAATPVMWRICLKQGSPGEDIGRVRLPDSGRIVAWAGHTLRAP